MNFFVKSTFQGLWPWAFDLLTQIFAWILLHWWVDTPMSFGPIQAFCLGKKNPNLNFQLNFLGFFRSWNFQGRAIFLTERATITYYISF